VITCIAVCLIVVALLYVLKEPDDDDWRQL